MRIGFLKKVAVVLFLSLVAALAYNQIYKGFHYSLLSQNNRVKLIKLDAPRGIIYDRNGEVIAGLRLVFNIALMPQQVYRIEENIALLSPILEIPEKTLIKHYKKNFFAPFSPVIIARDVPKETAIILESQESDIPGLIVQAQALRNYPYSQSLSHVLGYLGKITEEELKQFKIYGMWDKNLLGRGGIEQQYDSLLRGQTGGMQIEVNNRGYQVRVLGTKEPEPGMNLELSIDAKLQTFADAQLEGETGVCIVMDCQNGEILAMVSKPSFDPELFILALNDKEEALKEVSKVLSSKKAPLMNRAISALYSPGSIFKIIVAAAALESKKINLKSSINCSGSVRVGNRDFYCWKLDGHGNQDVYSALAHSCNSFFYKVGLMLGPDKISQFSRHFGLGERSEIDLPSETSGLVPSKAWKLKTKKERWYDGETANFSIGQGYLLVTPLQLCRVIAVVANNGYLIEPHLIRGRGEKKIVAGRKKLQLKTSTLNAIKEGMRMAVQNPDGTAHRAYIGGEEWAAKTGTVQTSSGRPHGWFGGFYPYEKPHISIIVFLEHGESGGEVPALIAREIINFIKEKEEEL